MQDIRALVLLDDVTLPLHGTDLELLTLARTLGPVTAVSFDAPGPDVLGQMGEYGVQDSLVLATRGSTETGHLTPVRAHALVQAITATGASLVLARATFANKEVTALAAFETGAGLITDTSRVEVRANGSLLGAKRVFAGSWDIEFTNQRELSILTVRANALRPEAAPNRTSPLVRELEVTPGSRVEQVQVLSRTVHEPPADQGPARPSLAEAQIVVAAGRGTLGDFSDVYELADVLGAAVGSTRDCVDEGWISHDTQVGQTGVTIAPLLYIGAGVSGAPHHRGGMQASEIIVAVNSDPECPLFEMSDFAVVGNLAEVLPEATRALREHLDGQS